MRVHLSAILVLTPLLLTVPVFANAGGAGLARAVEQVPEVLHVFKAGRYSRRASLALLTARDLSFATKVDNVNGLLDLAVSEQRIDTIEAMALAGRFAKAGRGDELLIICLRAKECNPDTYLTIAQQSQLHADVIQRAPALGIEQANNAVGDFTERLMHRYFGQSGWSRINGQVGRAGIDGLYVKEKDGVITDVLMAESKYNTSALKPTNHGQQMSYDWTKKKISDLRVLYPESSQYAQIERIVDEGAYRAVVWNLKVDNKRIVISLVNTKSKADDVVVSPTLVGDATDPLALPTNTVKFGAPRNAFERTLLRWYEDELDAIGPRPLI